MYYEYKILAIDEMALGIIEKKINSLANKKWRVVATSSSVGEGSWGNFILLERERT